MPPTKDQIVEKLIELDIEHDPKASKAALTSLLPEDLRNEVSEAKAESDGDPIVQLGSNQADHQIGETFTQAEAEDLDILEHCHAFKG